MLEKGKSVKVNESIAAPLIGVLVPDYLITGNESSIQCCQPQRGRNTDPRSMRRGVFWPLFQYTSLC